MSSIAMTVKTQFDAVLGPPGTLKLSIEDGDAVYVIYVVLLHSINFFLLVNFALAIVVGGYDRHQQDIAKSDIQHDVLTDTWWAFRMCCHWLRYGWPSPGRLACDLEKLPGMFITVPWGSTKVPCPFSAAGANAFNHFYAKMPALFNSDGEATSLEHTVHVVEGRLNTRLIKLDLLQHHAYQKEHHLSHEHHHYLESARHSLSHEARAADERNELTEQTHATRADL